MHRGLLFQAALVVTVAAGCRKNPSADAGRPDAGAAPGVVIVGPAIEELVLPGGEGEPLRVCRAARRRSDWSAPGAPSLGLQIKTAHARGTREQVIALARQMVCDEDGIPAERCTADMFDVRYEGCQGDPRAELDLTPEEQAFIDRMRARLEGGAGSPEVPAPEGEPGPAQPLLH
jgi:hypothetical protein